MLINLICSEPLRRILAEILEARGLHINPEARITLLEKGQPFPEQGIAVVFEYQTLSDLTDFLDELARKPDANKTVIVGKREAAESFEIIPYEAILYFEAAGNYTYCVTPDGKLRVKNKLYELEATLPEQGFTRISKSILVNIMAVVEIIPWFGSRLLLKLKDKSEIEVSRSYVKEFKDFLEL